MVDVPSVRFVPAIRAANAASSLLDVALSEP